MNDLFPFRAYSRHLIILGKCLPLGITLSYSACLCGSSFLRGNIFKPYEDYQNKFKWQSLKMLNCKITYVCTSHVDYIPSLVIALPRVKKYNLTVIKCLLWTGPYFGVAMRNKTIGIVYYFATNRHSSHYFYIKITFSEVSCGAFFL